MCGIDDIRDLARELREILEEERFLAKMLERAKLRRDGIVLRLEMHRGQRDWVMIKDIVHDAGGFPR